MAGSTKKKIPGIRLGLWAMILQDTGAMIGQAGLTLQPYKNTRIPEIGYLLKKEYRRRGYAKEAQQAAGITHSGS